MSIVRNRIQESIDTKKRILESVNVINSIERVAAEIILCLKSGGKLIIGGNGGSESDSLHFAGEIVGRFQRERNPWPAIVLGSDPATLTAIANDYGYDKTYARQAKAYSKQGDILFVISTSGNSKNLVNAIEAVSESGCKTIALLGHDGGVMKDMVDYTIIVPSDVTARIQESHITIIHILCEIIEDSMNE